MILAGDIGGTKTLLALVDPQAGIGQPVRETRFSSKDYPSLDAMLADFLTDGSTVGNAAPPICPGSSMPMSSATISIFPTSS